MTANNWSDVKINANENSIQTWSKFDDSILGTFDFVFYDASLVIISVYDYSKGFASQLPTSTENL